MTKHGLATKFVDEAVTFSGDECLMWPFGRTSAGYGNLTVSGKKQSAHRVICERVNGPAPSPSHEAAHTCGNGHLGCVSPAHLKWKSRKENAQDTIVHGTSLRGNKRDNTKLDPEKVKAIRFANNSASQREVAELFGIDQSHVSRIRSKLAWQWLD